MLLWGRGSWDRAGSRCHPREQRNKELEVLEKGSGSYRHHMTSSLGEGIVSALHISDKNKRQIKSALQSTNNLAGFKD